MMLKLRTICLCAVLVFILTNDVAAKRSKKSKRNKDKDESDDKVVDYPSYGFNNDDNYQTTPPEQNSMYEDTTTSMYGNNMNGLFSSNSNDGTMPTYASGFSFDSPDAQMLGVSSGLSDSIEPQGTMSLFPMNDPQNDAPVYGTKIKAKDGDKTKHMSSYNEQLGMDNIYNYASSWSGTGGGDISKPIPPTYIDDNYKGTIDLTENKDKDQLDYINTDFKNDFDFTGTINKMRDVMDTTQKDNYKSNADGFRGGKKNTYNSEYGKDSFKNSDIYTSYKDQFKHLNKYEDNKNSLEYTTKTPSVRISQFSSGPEKPSSSSSTFNTNFGGSGSGFKSSFNFDNNVPYTSTYFGNAFGSTKYGQTIKSHPDIVSSETTYGDSNGKKKNYDEYKNAFKPSWTNDYTDDSRPTSDYSKYSQNFDTYVTSSSNKKYKYKNENNDFKNTFTAPSYGASSYSKPDADNTKYANSYSDYESNNKGANVYDFTNTKGMKNVDYSSMQSWYPQKSNEKYKDYSNYKYDPMTTTTQSSSWGSNFKSQHASYSQGYKYKPQQDDDEKVVHIKPKKPSKHYPKYGGSKTIDEWNREVANKFKSEEELLGLRNHDTSHPTYLPSFKFNNGDETNGMKNYAASYDYSTAIDKWRNMKLHMKKPNSFMDNSPSESGVQNVIEIPHPIIIPVPQPYPVKVPIPKPVAVPVYRELTIPVEKPVPYPVIKKVPYPIEKPVPVPIEKQVAVPVPKPYPVPIPHVKPVFHHSRYVNDDIDHSEDFDENEDDDFAPIRNTEPLRPSQSKRITIRPKRTHKTRYHTRSRTRNSYNRRGNKSRKNRFYRRQNNGRYGHRFNGRSLDSNSEHDHKDYFELCHNFFGKICKV